MITSEEDINMEATRLVIKNRLFLNIRLQLHDIQHVMWQINVQLLHNYELFRQLDLISTYKL